MKPFLNRIFPMPRQMIRRHIPSRLTLSVASWASLMLAALPAFGGTINTFTGATDNLTGTNTNYAPASGTAAPINGTASGSYKDILFTGSQFNLLQTNTNYHSESLSVTNGSSYSIAGFSANAPTIRVGSTSNTGASEVIAPLPMRTFLQEQALAART